MSAITYQPTVFQQRVLSLPLDVETIAADGGRGGGKSWLIAFLILQHIEIFGLKASVLYCRQSHSGLRDFEKIFLTLAKAAYPDFQYNLKENLARFPNGATCELNQFTTFQQSYEKFQGRSFTFIAVDELGNYADPHEVTDALRSNLRGPSDVHCRMVLAMNPGSAGHIPCMRRYVTALPPYQITSLPGVSDRIVRVPSTYLDNSALNQEAYKRSLEQSSANDPARYASWLLGDWSAGTSGQFFAHVYDEDRNVLAEPFHSWPPSARPAIALDWGSYRPTVALLLANFPRGHILPSGIIMPPRSVCVMDEVTTASPDNLNQGNGDPPEAVAIEIQKVWNFWELPGRPFGSADDAIFCKPGGRTSPSIADQFKSAGVDLRKASKGRRDWTQVRSMMSNAGQSRTEPGIWFSPAASYCLNTIPNLPRDPRRPDDLNSNTADHGADALRYGILGCGFRREAVARRISTYRGDGDAAYFAKLDREINFQNEAKRRARNAQ